MDYITNLIKAHKHLLKIVKERAARDSDPDFYYEKYLKSNEENLALKEKISTLETQVFSLNKEINKRNIEIQKLSKS